MKKIALFMSMMVIITSFSSCKSFNYMKEENLSKVKNQPFEEKDFQDNDKEFYVITSVRGTNMNINRNRALMSAKTLLAGKIKNGVDILAEQTLSADQNGTELEAFQQKSTSVSNLSIEKIMLIDSQILRENDGDAYDYWVVYKVAVDEVVKIVNDSDLGITVNPTQLLNAVNTDEDGD
jgi:hypothetical protein